MCDCICLCFLCCLATRKSYLHKLRWIAIQTWFQICGHILVDIFFIVLIKATSIAEEFTNAFNEVTTSNAAFEISWGFWSTLAAYQNDFFILLITSIVIHVIWGGVTVLIMSLERKSLSDQRTSVAVWTISAALILCFDIVAVALMGDHAREVSDAFTINVDFVNKGGSEYIDVNFSAFYFGAAIPAIYFTRLLWQILNIVCLIMGISIYREIGHLKRTELTQGITGQPGIPVFVSPGDAGYVQSGYNPNMVAYAVPAGQTQYGNPNAAMTNQQAEQQNNYINPSWFLVPQTYGNEVSAIPRPGQAVHPTKAPQQQQHYAAAPNQQSHGNEYI